MRRHADLDNGDSVRIGYEKLAGLIRKFKNFRGSQALGGNSGLVTAYLNLLESALKDAINAKRWENPDTVPDNLTHLDLIFGLLREQCQKKNLPGDRPGTVTSPDSHGSGESEHPIK